MKTVLILVFLISMADVTKTSYSDNYKRSLLNGLNTKRDVLANQEGATAMFAVEWDVDLEARAMEKVKRCLRERDDDWNFFSIFDATLSRFPAHAQETFDQKDIERGFTRFARWDLTKLGCAYNFCETLLGRDEAQNVYLLGCAFKFRTDPTSEADFNHLFDRGVVCQNCSDYSRVCSNSLCT